MNISKFTKCHDFDDFITDQSHEPPELRETLLSDKYSMNVLKTIFEAVPNSNGTCYLLLCFSLLKEVTIIYITLTLNTKLKVRRKKLKKVTYIICAHNVISSA